MLQTAMNSHAMIGGAESGYLACALSQSQYAQDFRPPGHVPGLQPVLAEIDTAYRDEQRAKSAAYVWYCGWAYACVVCFVDLRELP